MFHFPAYINKYINPSPYSLVKHSRLNLIGKYLLSLFDKVNYYNFNQLRQQRSLVAKGKDMKMLSRLLCVCIVMHRISAPTKIGKRFVMENVFIAYRRGLGISIE